jgi:peptide/nickel transport system substrate-binding protein
MKCHRFFKILILFLLPALLLTGCWQNNTNSNSIAGLDSSSDSAASAEKIEAALPKSFSLPYFSSMTLDPITCADGCQQTVAALLYEGMFELDQNLEPQPRLCTGGSWDSTTLTWNFQLRSGVTFSDGSALSASDCVKTITRAMVSDRYRDRLSGIKSVAANNGTVSITLNAANGNFSALLDIPVVKAGTEGNAVPIGTGPYQLVSDDTGTYLSANSGWWGGKTQPIQRIELMACQDDDSARYQFTSHNVQLFTTDLTGANPVSATGSFEFNDADTTILQYIGINTRKSLLASADLRHALSLGVDRNTIVSAYLSGHGKVTQFPISPVSQEYPSDLEEKYSVNTYLDTMKTLGYTSGSSHTLKMIVNNENSFKVSVAKSIAESLSSDTDLNIQVEELTWEDYLAALQRGNYDLYFGEVKLTADWNLQPLVGTGGSLNYGGFSDATLDLLLSEYAAASDQSAAMRAVCSYFEKQAPILPICFKCTSVLTQQGVVDNLTPTASNPLYDIGTCTIHLAP